MKIFRRGPPNGGVECRWGMKKSRLWPMCLCLRNGTGLQDSATATDNVRVHGNEYRAALMSANPYRSRPNHELTSDKDALCVHISVVTQSVRSCYYFPSLACYYPSNYGMQTARPIALCIQQDNENAIRPARVFFRVCICMEDIYYVFIRSERAASKKTNN